MNTIEIGILGSLRLKVEDNEVALPGTKLRSILAILAVRTGNAVARDVLIEELGLTETTTNAANALHAHVSRLRRWLCVHNAAPDVLETTDFGYRLNLGRAQIDANLFADRVEHALALAPDAPSVVATMLEEALRLWRGDALFDVIDGPLVAAIADELRWRRAAAREVLLEAWLALGNEHKVIVNARTFIADDPLNERLWESQIIALRKLGRHAQALDCFNRVRKILRDELGIQPGERLCSAVGFETRSANPDYRSAKGAIAQTSNRVHATVAV